MRKSIERGLWFIAAIAFAIYGMSAVETRMYQHALEQQFKQAVTVAAAPESIAKPVLKTKLASGQAIGRIEIPSIRMSAMIAEGVESGTLRGSVGHVRQTDLPGGSGNVGLAAHRDTFFRHLGELHKQDLISITTNDGRFDYLVESTGVVNPDESIVLRNIGRPTLTLVTCFPFYYVGPAPKRFIVHAALVQGH